MMKAKQELVQKLAQNQDWEYTRLQLEVLEQKQSISERLLNVFPGHYGKYVSLHFGLYLNEPILTKEQQEAFDLQQYLDEATKNFDTSFVVTVSENMSKAFRNPEKYISDNREILEQYIAFKQSDGYKNSPAYRLGELFATFNQESGYNDIFIPAMKTLSQAYRDYHEEMQRANEVFAEEFCSPSLHLYHN